MKRSVLTTGLCSILFLGCAVNGRTQQEPQVTDKGPEHHVLYTTGNINWKPGPASLRAGAEFAVLEGNPGEPGVFTMRLKLPNGFQISPHWHPNPERVTVISGTFLLGSGDVLDRSKVERLGPGSYTAMPPGMRHYAIAEGETVVQLTSTGPWMINYVNKADDPRSAP